MNLNHFNVIDSSIVGIYLVSMIVIGFLVTRFSKDDKDYFKGGNRIPWIMSGISLFISAFSAYMFVAASGQAYKAGLSCLLLFTSGAYGCVLVFFLFAHRWRRARITSPMEFIKMRFGNGVRYFISFFQIPLTMLGSANLFFVLGIFISSALGLTQEYKILWFSLNGLELCILVTGIVIALYTTSGGIWAVILTDTVQFIIVMVMSIIVIPLSFKALGEGSLFGGMNHFIQNPATPDYFKLVKPAQTLFFTLSWIVWSIFSFPGNFSLAQRAYSVPTEKDAKKTVLLTGLFFLIAPTIWVLPVFIMRPFLTNLEAVWPHLKNPAEGSYVTITLMLLPNGMIGLTISAILAATMSTVSTNYNIISSIFIRDIYKPFIDDRADTKKLMFVGKIFTLAFGILSIALAFYLANFGIGDAFTTTYTIVSHVGLTFALPIAAGLLIRRLPWWTPILSMPLSLLTTLSLEFYFGKYLGGIYPDGIFGHIKENAFSYKIFGAIIINMIVFVIAFFLYNENDPRNKKTEELFALLKKPVSEDADAALYIPNLKTYRIVGWVLAFFGFCMTGIYASGIVKDPKSVNLIAGLFFLALFGMIHWFTSPRFSPFALVRKQMGEKS